MALCYNFTRVLAILGFDAFTAYLVRRRARARAAVVHALDALRRRSSALLARRCGPPSSQKPKMSPAAPTQPHEPANIGFLPSLEAECGLRPMRRPPRAA
jgi:hypothetical protein